jgi:hypothetical protein
MIDDLHPKVEVVSYRIEVQEPDTGYWEEVDLVQPKYHYRFVKKRHWLFWTKEVEVIGNKNDAATKARRLAYKFAKDRMFGAQAHPRRVRIRMEIKFGDWRNLNVVWENGAWVE